MDSNKIGKLQKFWTKYALIGDKYCDMLNNVCIFG